MTEPEIPESRMVLADRVLQGFFNAGLKDLPLSRFVRIMGDYGFSFDGAMRVMAQLENAGGL